MADIEEIKVFYDDYTGTQSRVGINDRHRSIIKWMKKFGLNEDSTILEIGCGIGTQTELILECLGPNGYISASDLSPKSVEVAKTRLKDHANVDLYAANAVDYEFTGQYDMIVMPDVIEHIPLKYHQDLFTNLRRVVKDDGLLVIHIPDPHYLEWTRINHPERLQVIDQPIHTDILAKNVYECGWYMHFLSSYSIWKEPVDYQVVILKPTISDVDYQSKPVSSKKKIEKFGKRIRQKMNLILGQPINS